MGTDDAAHADETGAAWRWALLGLPAWLVSLVVHLALLLALAFCTFREETRADGVLVIAQTVEEPQDLTEALADFEFEVQTFDATLDSAAAPIADVGVIALGDMTLAAELDAPGELGELSFSELPLGEIGALFGRGGSGMVDVGDGLKAAASFFGARSRGTKFVFVVDNSNSMIRGRFETALLELMRTVDAMGPDQQFCVIFFSDTAYRMFHPEPAPGLVPATPRNKERLRSWLGTVQMCLRTQGREAVTAALAMNPDAIYILGDGVFTDDTTELLTAPHERRMPIHTLGMEVDARGEAQLRAIAQANHGTYRAVGASPEAQRLAQANPVRRNRTRGAVWGMKLPPVEEVKKKKKR